MNLLRLELKQQHERSRRQRLEFINRHFTKGDAFWIGVAAGAAFTAIGFVICAILF